MEPASLDTLSTGPMTRTSTRLAQKRLHDDTDMTESQALAVQQKSKKSKGAKAKATASSALAAAPNHPDQTMLVVPDTALPPAPTVATKSSQKRKQKTTKTADTAGNSDSMPTQVNPLEPAKSRSERKKKPSAVAQDGKQHFNARFLPLMNRLT
jgi:hypothetical protein